MFGFIRLAIGCILFCCIIWVLKKHKITFNYKRYIAFVIMIIAFIVILQFVPFENLFITFKSPRAAYEYVNGGKSEIKLVVEGTNSDLVVSNKDDTDMYLIVPKTKDGWKIGIASNTKWIVQAFSNGITIDVCQYKNSDDYFITIFNANGGYSKIEDSYNSRFFSIEKADDAPNSKFVTYYANLSKFDLQYWVNVNGEKITLLSQ